jgi:hypothetical protein
VKLWPKALLLYRALNQTLVLLRKVKPEATSFLDEVLIQHYRLGSS